MRRETFAILFSLSISLMSFAGVVYMNSRASELIKSAETLSDIINFNDPSLIAGDSCMAWLGEVRECLDLNKGDRNCDSLDQATLLMVLNTWKDVSIIDTDFKVQEQMRALDINVNLSRPVRLRVWLIEQNDTLKLHSMEGMCDLYERLKLSKKSETRKNS